MVVFLLLVIIAILLISHGPLIWAFLGRVAEAFGAIMVLLAGVGLLVWAGEAIGRHGGLLLWAWQALGSSPLFPRLVQYGALLVGIGGGLWLAVLFLAWDARRESRADPGARERRTPAEKIADIAAEFEAEHERLMSEFRRDVGQEGDKR